MWCRQCQQDVPAMRGGGPPRCPRCSGALGGPANDAGIELASYDDEPVAHAPPTLDSAAGQLRQLGWRLRPAPAADFTVGGAPVLAAVPLVRIPRQAVDETPLLWGPTTVIMAGMAALAASLAAVAAHAAGHASVDVWRGGLVAALAGEGLLVAGFAWPPGRLWRSNRRLARRIDALETQQAELRTARSPAASPSRFSSRAA
ncbi:MAG TPA: hypothetical protein PJ982_19730 [Lacipirellulaceae bacterium]|nr:hypothetical protein [Lacipirellulaceae bacterium]